MIELKRKSRQNKAPSKTKNPDLNFINCKQMNINNQNYILAFYIKMKVKNTSLIILEN